VTGTSGEASGTLFYNASVGATPFEIQITSRPRPGPHHRRVLYVVVPAAAFTTSSHPSAPPPFTPARSFRCPTTRMWPIPTRPPRRPTSSWPGFDVQEHRELRHEPVRTLAYGADETYGIVKFTNNAGTWVQAPYYFNSTNLGTFQQPAAQQGCFGICVDFSGTNPVIYATTMEAGALTTGNKQGNANANRLLRIVDTGLAPGTNLVAITLATATTTNEAFRGIDFTPTCARSSPPIRSPSRPRTTAVPASGWGPVPPTR